MIELCELSLHGQKDANGAAVPLMPASESVKHIHLASTDICKFYQPTFVGQIFEIQSKVIYVDPKKGLAYVQVESHSYDPYTAISPDVINQFDAAQCNTLNFTYKVDKHIELKHVMPKSYTESLLFLQGMRIIDAI